MSSNKIEWHEEASCKGLDGDIFFPEVPAGVNHRNLFNEAKKICSTCPVKGRCLDFAMQMEVNDIRRFGVWGGLTPRERDTLGRKTGK
jgi:WhiB family redox-sensing transcriptional regulator